MDIQRTGYHKCLDMPEEEFIEKQQSNWHIHRINEPHSKYRINIHNNICPYCMKELKEN